MANHENRYFIKEKGYRNGMYGQIITTVEINGTEETRTEKFIPLEKDHVEKPIKPVSGSIEVSNS